MMRPLIGEKTGVAWILGSTLLMIIHSSSVKFALDRTFPDLHDRYWLIALLCANLFLALQERSSISGFKTIRARWALRLAQFEGLHPWLIPGC
jgi:hypothetical protein